MTSHNAPSTASGPGNRYLIAAIAAFMVLLVVLLWSAGADHAQSAPPAATPDTVATDVVHIQQGFSVPLSLRGLIESAQRAELGFDIAGKLTRLNAEEGDVVSQGQPLAALDTARLQARVKELEAALARATANAELARLSNTRVTELVNKQLESAQRRDESSAQLRVATAEVAEVKAALQTVRVELDKSELNAPFDGQVVARYVDEGSTVTPATPVYRLSNNSRLQARFAVPAQDISEFSDNQQVDVMVGERSYVARVTQRISQRSTQTRTVDMLVTFTHTASLLPGDMAVITVERLRPEQGAWVPVSALSNGLRGLWTLFVLTDNTETQNVNRVKARSVEVVYSDGRRAFVRGALRDGEQFVTGGTHKLSPGQLVVTRQSHANSKQAGQ